MSELEEIFNAPVYKHYTIKKKRGGERHIFAPEAVLKHIQRRLNRYLQMSYLQIKPNEVHGFVINPRFYDNQCNIVANAAPHTGKKHLLNIDIKDFFPSISAKRIMNLFLSPSFNYPQQVAIALTLLTTYQGKLPTGAPTSPVLSNFVCLELDACLLTFCMENRLQYTRYADDLTFSSYQVIPQETIQNIISLIHTNGFEINNKKLRVQSSNRRQTVTGLTVNKKVNVERRLLKKIRAMHHDLITNGAKAATKKHFNISEAVYASCYPRHLNLFTNRLKGYISFVGQIRGKDDAVYQGLNLGVGGC